MGKFIPAFGLHGTRRKRRPPYLQRQPLSTMNTLSRVATALGITFLIVGCGDDVPDLVSTPWQSLEIEYCTSKGETRVWKSPDVGELQQFRALMAPATPKGLTMILTSYTNEIRLTLASGQKWKFYYRDKPTSMTFHDPDSITRSFTVGISDALYSRLSSTLIASGGEAISLKGDCRIPSMEGK